MTHLDVCWSAWVVGDENQLNFEHEKYDISIRCQIKLAEVEKLKKAQGIQHLRANRGGASKRDCRDTQRDRKNTRNWGISKPSED